MPDSFWRALFSEDVKARLCAQPGHPRVGDVEDLTQFYGSIGIFINPLRQGRGLRTKVVEAAAFGRRFLSTAFGAEGLEELQLRLCETRSNSWKPFKALVGKRGVSQHGRAQPPGRSPRFSATEAGGNFDGRSGSTSGGAGRERRTRPACMLISKRNPGVPLGCLRSLAGLPCARASS